MKQTVLYIIILCRTHYGLIHTLQYDVAQYVLLMIFIQTTGKMQKKCKSKRSIICSSTEEQNSDRYCEVNFYFLGRQDWSKIFLYDAIFSFKIYRYFRDDFLKLWSIPRLFGFAIQDTIMQSEVIKFKHSNFYVSLVIDWQQKMNAINDISWTWTLRRA